MANKRIYGPAQLTNAAATKYTSPTGIRTTIKRIHVVNTDSSSHTFTFSIGADAAGTELYKTVTVAANGGYFDDYANYSLEAAEIIQAYADANSVLTMTINAILEATG